MNLHEETTTGITSQTMHAAGARTGVVVVVTLLIATWGCDRNPAAVVAQEGASAPTTAQADAPRVNAPTPQAIEEAGRRSSSLAVKEWCLEAMARDTPIASGYWERKVAELDGRNPVRQAQKDFSNGKRSFLGLDGYAPNQPRGADVEALKARGIPYTVERMMDKCLDPRVCVWTPLRIKYSAIAEFYASWYNRTLSRLLLGLEIQDSAAAKASEGSPDATICDPFTSAVEVEGAGIPSQVLSR